MDIFKSILKSLFGKVNDTQTIVGFSDTSGSDSPYVTVRIRTLDYEHFDTSYDRVMVITPKTIWDFLDRSVYEKCDNFVKVSFPIICDLFNKSSDTDFMVLSHKGLSINGVSHHSPFPSLPQEVFRIEIYKDNPYSFKFFLKDRKFFTNGRLMSIEDIAKDIVLEIAYGSGRMDKSDFKRIGCS